MEDSEEERDDSASIATAKIKIRRGPFSASPRVKGPNSVLYIAISTGASERKTTFGA